MSSHRTVVTAIVFAAAASWTIAALAAPAAAEQPAAEEVPGEPKTVPQPPDSDDGRCDACGGCVRVHKVCVPRPKEREVKKVCWSYREEDFCIPGPSQHCGTRCKQDACGWWTLEFWKPTWAEVRTRRVPVKTVTTRTVPGFEWRPEERCAACRGGHADTTCAAEAAP